MGTPSEPSFRLPARTDYWLYCADTWTRILLRLLTPDTKTVYDLCCGWSPKIEMALLSTQFNGTVCAVDISRPALLLHRNYMHLFRPKFRVRYGPHDILGTGNLRLPKADLIIGNHILDDLLLRAYSLTVQTPDYELFEKPEILESVWKTILKDTARTAKVIRQFVAFTGAHLADGGILALSQYPGYQDTLYRSETARAMHRMLLSETKSAFLGNRVFGVYRKRTDTAFQSLSEPYFPAGSLLVLQKR